MPRIDSQSAPHQQGSFDKSPLLDSASKASRGIRLQKRPYNIRTKQALDVLSVSDATPKAIAFLTGMSGRWAKQICTDLYREGLLTRVKREQQGMGRPPYLYSIKERA